MKKIILFVIPFFYYGCVSMSEHQILQDNYNNLLQKYNTLEKEVTELKQTADYYYKTGIDYYNSSDYKNALNCFQNVVNKFPADKLATPSKSKIEEIKKIADTNYNSVNLSLKNEKELQNKITILEDALAAKYFSDNDINNLQEKKDEFEKELRLKQELEKNIEKKEDKMQKCFFFENKRDTNQKVDYGKKFQVELYIVYNYENKTKNLRIRTRYSASDWMFYEDVILLGDNDAQIEIKCEYPEKKSDNGSYGVWEWSDNYINKENEKILIKLAEANKIQVRFKGQYTYDYEMNENQLMTLKEIIQKYKSIKLD